MIGCGFLKVIYLQCYSGAFDIYFRFINTKAFDSTEYTRFAVMNEPYSYCRASLLSRDPRRGQVCFSRQSESVEK